MPVVATGVISTESLSELPEDPQAFKNSAATSVRNASLVAAKILEMFMVFPTDLNKIRLLFSQSITHKTRRNRRKKQTFT
jgi:hypothetical protein